MLWRPVRPSHQYDWSERARAGPLGTGTSAERHAEAEENGGNRVFALIGCASASKKSRNFIHVILREVWFTQRGGGRVLVAA